MYLTSLRLHHVRKIDQAQLSPDPHFNIIYGANGSGKTSLLESIYYLATGRSFRTPKAAEVISHGSQALTVNGVFESTNMEKQTIGIEKTAKATRLRINGNTIKSSSELARKVPVLTLDTSSFEVLNGGPSNRRTLLDRLLFHVEPDYLSLLKEYYRALKQRNVLLRSRSTRRQIESWEPAIAETGQRIDQLRKECVSRINFHLGEGGKSSVVKGLSLDYRRGWPSNSALDEVLKNHFLRDSDAGTTGVGPHRAELQIKVNGKLAKATASRGQGKLIISAITSAQIHFMAEARRMTPIVLVDDLPSELDRETRSVAVDCLTQTKAQLFFTTIDRDDLPRDFVKSAKVFHVEHGVVGSCELTTRQSGVSHV